MCGIAGIIRVGGGADERRGRARAMRTRLAHRGPDGEGELVRPSAVLEHTRLALLDREGGAQPMSTPDGRFSLVYNGEIYNHEALRRELPYPFRTRSDAETLLAAYATWGEACVARLNGMFAFFVWDDLAKRGFAARDRLGVKPLAYAWDGEEFVFASEAQAIAGTAPARPRIHEASYLEYLVAPYFSGVEHPMFDGIEYLAPGHLLVVDRDGPRARQYWSYRPAASFSGEGAAEELRARLTAAVRRAEMADVPVGTFLSGGLDSTLVSSLAARHFAEAPGGYTIAFEGMDAYDYARSTIVVSDDAPFARLAAGTLGLPLTEVPVPRRELAADLERIARTNDALPAWEQEIAQDRLARAASQHHKAVLVGDAADETHFGYHFLLDAEATESPRRILERFGPTPIRRDVLADPLATFEAKYRAWMPPSPNAEDRIAGVTALIVDRWLPRLLHNGDIHAMRSSLEARVPFADVDLLELARAIPASLGLAKGVEKALLREAARGLVPEAIRTRRKSALPKDQGAASTYKAEARDLLASPPALVADFVDLAEIRTLLHPARRLAEQERATLFRLIAIGHFSRHHGLP